MHIGKLVFASTHTALVSQLVWLSLTARCHHPLILRKGVWCYKHTYNG